MKNINRNMLHMKLKMAVCSAALLAFLPTSAYCGVCFLPDCQDSDTLHGDVNMNVNNDTEWCEKKGYTYYSSGKCPQYYAQVGKCKKDDYYLKCDAKTWCQQNGYNTTTCSIPNYVDQPCPSFATLYKGCKRDNQRACRDTGYTNSCPSGQKLHASGRCSYDNNFGTCCRPSGCPANTSLSYSSYGANGSDGCGYTCYYTCNPNCPSGTSTSNPGGCGGSTKNGCRTKTCYYPYQSCCTPYGDESGCNCYSCSDGCGGTRQCCGSCYTPPPSSGNSGGGGGGSGSGSGSGSSGSGNNPDDCKPGTTYIIGTSYNGWCDWGNSPNSGGGKYVYCQRQKFCTTYGGSKKELNVGYYRALGPFWDDDGNGDGGEGECQAAKGTGKNCDEGEIIWQ